MPNPVTGRMANTMQPTLPSATTVSAGMSGSHYNVNIGRVDLVAPAGNYYDSSNVVHINDRRQHKAWDHAGGHSGVDLAATVKELNAHISAGCMHNSADRLEAPKCHEDTRKAVQEDIFSWISDGPSNEILWLTGPAGTGKSAIMGTVADKLKERGQLAATYYFSSFARSLERKSKRGFVTTLAYQLQQCEGLDPPVSLAILSAVQDNPAIFQMTLQEQMERLVLRPLLAAQVPANSNSQMVVLVDGVDECGEDRYDLFGTSSRQGDQIEVLSVLLRAAKHPVFPFRVIVASRPESHIRDFTSKAPTRVTEIFLDSKYSPDDDIRLFLKSKFAELRRRYGLDPSTWPTEDAIVKLVQDASGQFIYAATVLRFIDTPGTLPQTQLEIVLKINPRDSANPFSVLDALYTSILMSSPSPDNTVLWFKALQSFQNVVSEHPGSLSAWTIDHLFESVAGQALMLLRLPSLVYIPKWDPYNRKISDPCDLRHYGEALQISPYLIPDVGWDTGYAFYHKSFLDYLEDHSRCGAAFPDIDSRQVWQWIYGRLAQTLKCGGPEVPTHPTLRLVFQRCFLDILAALGRAPALDWRIDDTTLSECETAEWLGGPIRNLPPRRPSTLWQAGVEQVLFITVHKNCRSYRPCSRGCKRWRKAISKLPSNEWRPYWNPLELLLDKFCVKRLQHSVVPLSERFE